MEVTKESLHSPNTHLDEVPQNKLETVINNKLPLEEKKEDFLYTSDESYLYKNKLCNLQKDAQNKNTDVIKGEIYSKANKEISNEESVDENVKDTVEEMLKKAQLDCSSNSKKVLDDKNIQENLNYSIASGNSSSDEEILQTRFPVQNEEYNSPKSSVSFVSISDNESSLENYSEMKRPLVIQALAYDEEKTTDCKTNGSNSESNKQAEKTEYQEGAIDKANYSFLSIDVDNSNTETESSYMQNSIVNKNINLNFDESKIENTNLLQEEVKIAKNGKTLDQNEQERNNISNIIIKDFLDGSFDINSFKPEKNSTMIKDKKMVTKQKRLIKDEYPPSKMKKHRENVPKHANNNKKVHSLLDYNGKVKHNILNNKISANSNNDLITQLKRKVSEKQTKNSKKARMIPDKNKDKVTDMISDKLTFKTKFKLENKYSRTNNQRTGVNKKLQYNDKTILSNFKIREENSKKSKIKNNAEKTKSHKNEEIFKDFSNSIAPLKKSRNLRKSSLVASKKIREIEKLENDYSGEEILLDSDNSDFIFDIERIEDDFKNIFKDKKQPPRYKAENKLEKNKLQNEGITNISDTSKLESFQTCFEKQGRRESKSTVRNKRKYENKIENILDTCQLKMDNIASEENIISDPYQPNFLVEENEETNINCQNNIKRISNRRECKSNKRRENKLLEYGKNIGETTSSKMDTTSTMNYGVTTRSKKKTWDTLEKELLGESNGTSFTNNVTKTVPFNNQSIGKQSMKDVDLYLTSNKLMIPTISVPDKRSKYEAKCKIQDSENKYLQTLVNNTQANEIIPYKSKSIIEKAIAAMEKCAADFIVPKKSFAQKEWIDSRIEFDDMTDEISIDQESEFLSNMTFVTKENEKYYKREIVSIVKQSSSMKSETPRRNTTRAMYSGEEYKYDFSDAEHLIKKSIITESYLVKDNSEGALETKSQSLIPSSNKEQSDPWGNLINKLNLEQHNNENKGKAILNGTPNRKSQSLKQHTNAHPDIAMQLIENLNRRTFYKQDEIEKEENEHVLKQLVYEETSAESHHKDICNDLSIEDNCITNDTEVERNDKKAILGRKSTEAKLETKERQTLQMKKVKTSPKFKLQVEEDGVKCKRWNRSFSSSSEESEKQKQRSTKHDDNRKLPKDQQKLRRQKYKKYLNNMFEKGKSKNNKIESISEKKNSEKYSVKDKDKEQEKTTNILIAKDDDDLFSISSSDSETVNKGTGILCDFFDE